MVRYGPIRAAIPIIWRPAGRRAGQGPKPRQEKRPEKTAGAPKRKFSYKEQREFETIDGEIAALEAQIAQVQAEQAANASDYVTLQTLQQRQEALETVLEEKMERWVYLNDLAEQIANQEK